ncbi:baseplate J/gp47 family protein [Helicobacter sp. 11S02629-2]|uniref:baseplate J/gp47 family protein n=1 Tax=Helicobacter sp. 11S02629-2 TaxID=1476195 RepID=UPI000BA63694|nr:baseplate J/gp47 family protein [Helicobacter sp. 11S02629-2]PAF44176.1 hypothetical protein BKH40_06155 [Helicobacter sp. 11S02629-2]
MNSSQIPNFLKPLDIESTKASILESLKKELKIKQNIDYEPLVSDDFNILINIFLDTLSREVIKLNFIVANNYLPYSSGEFLDALVSLLGLKRNLGTKPQAKVKIKALRDTFLAKGTKFISTLGDIAYLKEDLNLKEGLEVQGVLESDKIGDIKTNILEIKNQLIESINLESEFIQDVQKESDSELRARFLESLARFSTAGSEKSYLFFSKVAGVAKVKVTSPQAGKIKALFHAKTDLSKEIEANLKDNTPITDSLEVKKAILKEVELTVKIKVKPNSNFATLQLAIENNLKGYFESLEIDESPPLNKLIALCFVDDKVEDARLEGLEELEADSIYVLKSVSVEPLV